MATMQAVSLGLATKTIPYTLKMADFTTDAGIKIQNFRKGTPEQYQAHHSRPQYHLLHEQ